MFDARKKKGGGNCPLPLMLHDKTVYILKMSS